MWPVIISESWIYMLLSISKDKNENLSYKNTPKVDEYEQGKIKHTMDREDKNEEVIWDGLQIPVDWVESMRAERCRNYIQQLIGITCMH